MLEAAARCSLSLVPAAGHDAVDEPPELELELELPPELELELEPPPELDPE